MALLVIYKRHVFSWIVNVESCLEELSLISTGVTKTKHNSTGNFEINFSRKVRPRKMTKIKEYFIQYSRLQLAFSNRPGRPSRFIFRYSQIWRKFWRKLLFLSLKWRKPIIIASLEARNSHRKCLFIKIHRFRRLKLTF